MSLRWCFFIYALKSLRFFFVPVIPSRLESESISLSRVRLVHLDKVLASIGGGTSLDSNSWS